MPFLALLCFSEISSAEDKLTIGSNAPALDIEHWIQDGNGKFKPVTDFKSDKVYVVEFWATWCGPCVKSMPHLVEMQTKYQDRGVQIISISDEPLDVIDKFLSRKVAGKEITYRELTSAYCLTSDSNQSSQESYMEAAGQNGIPCAFIVGKDKKIEWIGHPMEMDDVLEAVVENKWDRKAFAEQFEEQKRQEILMTNIQRALQTGKFDKAVGLIDAAIESAKSESSKSELKMMRVQLMLQSEKLTNDVRAAILEAYSKLNERADFVNMVAWTVFERSESEDWSDKELVKLSRQAAAKAAEKTKGGEKASILDTVAHLQFVEGDIPGAIKTQEEALRLADDDMKQELGEFLKKLKSSK